jgi:hypothetical protein
MPMVDKPASFCRDGLSELWDKLSTYVDFIETMGVALPIDCLDLPMPTNDEIEDAGCLAMCAIYTLSPIGRCIVPISASSFVELEC